MSPIFHRKDPFGAVRIWSFTNGCRGRREALIGLGSLSGLFAARQIPQALLLRLRRCHCRSNLSPDRCFVFDRALSVCPHPASLSLVLPQGERLRYTVPPPDRTPSAGFGILEVDVAHITRVVANVKGVQRAYQS